MLYNLNHFGYQQRKELKEALGVITNPESMTKVFAAILGGESGEKAGMDVLRDLAFMSKGGKEGRDKIIQHLQDMILRESKENLINYFEKSLNMSAGAATAAADWLKSNPENVKRMLNIDIGYLQTHTSAPPPSNKASGGSTNYLGTPDLKTTVDDLTKVLSQAADDFKNMSAALNKQQGG
jgi:hypothetical protein